MRHALGTLTLIVLVACATPPREARIADPASRRSTPAGDVVGFTGRYGSHVWLGIPFAAPPVGAQRWRAPAPPESWTEPRQALSFGSPCVQYASPLGGIDTAAANTPVGDEDCLYVNVYAPTTATPASRLPVMVWIHGGGNTIGAAELYDGGNLAATSGVVVVTVNYRLGPFGWFRHPAIRAGAAGDSEASGNFATLDLIRALKWVRESIVAFGGDPGRVTIFGESAGGTNVVTLMLSPMASGLFHRAIVQSGGIRMSPPEAGESAAAAHADQSVNTSEQIEARLRARGNAPVETDIARLLRETPAHDLLTLYTPMRGIGMIRMPTAFRDGTVLPRQEHLDRLRRPDGWNQVPVLLGTNRDEMRLFMFASPTWVRRVLWVLPRLNEPEQFDAVAEHLSRNWKALGVDELAAAMQASGARDVFTYRFDWDEEPSILGADLARMLGASHGFEIPFVFGHFDLGREGSRIFTRDNEPGRVALSREMMARWTRFAADGTPGWPPAPTTQVLDTPTGGGLRTIVEPASRDAVLAAIAADPRLPSPRDRCLAYHDLVIWATTLSRATYDRLCPEHPFDGYPWR
jgi:para-nitrobenzyl esterase